MQEHAGKGPFRQAAIGKGPFNTKQVLRFLYHLPRFAKLYWRLLGDPRVSLGPKILFFAGIAYVLSPVDLIPGWMFPVIGQLDDLVVLIASAQALVKLSPPDVVEEHVERIDAGR